MRSHAARLTLSPEFYWRDVRDPILRLPSQTTIVLVDGAQLADYMIDHDVGVTTSRKFEVKRVDSDYFTFE